MKIRVLLIALLGWLVTAPVMAADEVYVVVYKKTEDSAKGRRVHRDDFLLEPAEKRSATLTLCDIDLFNIDENVAKLKKYDDGKHLILLYKTTVDPVTKNTQRQEICRHNG